MHVESMVLRDHSSSQRPQQRSLLPHARPSGGSTSLSPACSSALQLPVHRPEIQPIALSCVLAVALAVCGLGQGHAKEGRQARPCDKRSIPPPGPHLFRLSGALSSTSQAAPPRVPGPPCRARPVAPSPSAHRASTHLLTRTHHFRSSHSGLDAPMPSATHRPRPEMIAQPVSPTCARKCL